jgi:hypothetical protein
MSFDPSASDPFRAGRVAPEPPAARRASEPGFAERLREQASVDARVDAIPAAPPAEVMDEILAAQRAIEDMLARGRTLHFAMDAGRMKILLQDLDGNTVRRIPATEALEISTGRKAV